MFYNPTPVVESHLAMSGNRRSAAQFDVNAPIVSPVNAKKFVCFSPFSSPTVLATCVPRCFLHFSKKKLYVFVCIISPSVTRGKFQLGHIRDSDQGPYSCQQDRLSSYCPAVKNTAPGLPKCLEARLPNLTSFLKRSRPSISQHNVIFRCLW